MSTCVFVEAPRDLRRRGFRGGVFPGLGSAAKCAQHPAQYTPLSPFRRSHSPPHRSQYFKSSWISCSIVPLMQFKIASRFSEPNEKALTDNLGSGLVSLTMAWNAI
jgi:hypothetical protein